MNYYPFHLGDYAAHTAHLEPMEDLAYRRMLDLYYRTEAPLPRDVEQLARLIRMKGHEQAICQVLDEFFEDCSEGWMHARCDAEIAKMQDKQAKAKASAAASVKARSTNAQRSLNERSTVVELPTPTPVINTPLPPKGGEGEQVIPACPYDAIVKAYTEELPTLPGVRLMDAKRQRAMRQRWAWVLSSTKGDGTRRATNTAEGLAWFRDYFARVRSNAWLMGESPSKGHENWTADLDYLMTDRGLKAVIERTKVAA